MASRRDFLTTMAVGAAALRPAWSAETPEVKTGLNGPVGLQLYSVRESMKKDVPGTLAKVRALGIREVETAGTWGQSAADHRAALDKAGLEPYHHSPEASRREAEKEYDLVLTAAKKLGLVK